MACNPKTIEKIMGKVTVKMLPFIKKKPNYERINEMMELLYTNMVTLTTPQGRGHHSHIGSIMKPKLYITLTTTAWANPNDLIVYPMIVKNSTTYLREQLQLQYKEGNRINENMVTMY